MLDVILECEWGPAEHQKKWNEITTSTTKTIFKNRTKKKHIFNLTANIDVIYRLWLCHLHLSATSGIDSIESIQYYSLALYRLLSLSLSIARCVLLFFIQLIFFSTLFSLLNCKNWSALGCEWIYCLLSNNKLMQSHSNLFVHICCVRFSPYMSTTVSICNDIMSFSSRLKQALVNMILNEFKQYKTSTMQCAPLSACTWESMPVAL